MKIKLEFKTKFSKEKCLDIISRNSNHWYNFRINKPLFSTDHGAYSFYLSEPHGVRKFMIGRVREVGFQFHPAPDGGTTIEGSYKENGFLSDLLYQLVIYFVLFGCVFSVIFLKAPQYFLEMIVSAVVVFIAFTIFDLFLHFIGEEADEKLIEMFEGYDVRRSNMK